MTNTANRENKPLTPEEADALSGFIARMTMKQLFDLIRLIYTELGWRMSKGLHWDPAQGVYHPKEQRDGD